MWEGHWGPLQGVSQEHRLIAMTLNKDGFRYGMSIRWTVDDDIDDDGFRHGMSAIWIVDGWNDRRWKADDVVVLISVGAVDVE